MDEKIQKSAKQLSQALVTDKRNDGQEFVKLKDGSPDWMTEVIRSAHGESFPDDTIYEFIDRAASAFADADPDSDESDVIAEIDPDIYTSNLTAWLNKRNDHVYYLTEALEEFGGDIKDGFQLLAMAQKLQIDEIAYALFNALDNLEDPDESPDEDPDSDNPFAENGDLMKNLRADMESAMDDQAAEEDQSDSD